MAGAALVGCGEADKAADDAKPKSTAAATGAEAAPGADEELQAMTAGACAKKTYFTRGGKKFLTFGFSRAMKTDISKGPQSKLVWEAQCLLVNQRCKLGQVDGIFGDKTRKATILFQKKDRGLMVDGAIGKQTWPKLRDARASKC